MRALQSLQATRVQATSKRMLKKLATKSFRTLATLFVVGGVLGIGITSASYHAFFVRDTVDDRNELNADLLERSNAPTETTATTKRFLDLARQLPVLSSQVALGVLLTQADEDQLLKFLEQSTNSQFSSRNWQARVQFETVRRLATLNPTRALDYVTSLPHSRQQALIAAVFREWSLVDLDSAVEHMQSLRMSLKRIALREVFRVRDELTQDERYVMGDKVGAGSFVSVVLAEEMASSLREKPESTWDAIVDDGVPDELQFDLLVKIAQALVDRDGLPSVLRLLETDTTSVGNSALLSIISKAASFDPVETFETFEDVSGWTGRNIYAQIMRAWAREDPIASLKFLSAQETDADLQLLRMVIVETWADTDPEGLVDQLHLIPHSMQSVAREKAMEGLGRQDPIVALQLVKTPDNGFNWNPHAYWVLRSWKETDPEGKLDWVLSTQDFPSPDERERVIMSTIINTAGMSSPQRAIELAQQHDGRDADSNDTALEVHVIDSLATVDIDLALSLIATTHEENRYEAYARVGFRLAMSQDYKMALKLAEHVSEEDQMDYHRLVISAWRRGSPADLIPYLDELPTREIQLHAARSLYNDYVIQGSLNEAQLDQLMPHLAEEDMKKVTSGEPIFIKPPPHRSQVQ